ncbi:MAG: GIY-YIG nuclease family protein [Candidatus Omnitrophica bacterium]|nr:GIY-YIG nuclease family protein [Candidatus Omnitrophota bacterium]
MKMNSIYYFYILKCDDGTKYYGHTDNLEERFKKHLKGQVVSTKNKRPLELAYWEELETRSEAFKREMQFKNGKTRKETIDQLIDSFPKTKCQGFNSARHLRSLALRK